MPIFIVGVPRSGTTILYQLMSQHPDLGCFTNKIIKKFLTDDFLNFVHLRRRMFELRKFPYPEDGFNIRFFSTLEIPMEGGYLYDLVFKGNWNPTVSEKNLKILKKTIIKTLLEQNRKRFLSKFPSNSTRIQAINKIFPDAKFIHIIRDGKAVVNSLMERSKENPNGYFGIPLKLSMSSFRKTNKIEKHSLQWQQVIDEIRMASKNLRKDQYMEIRYEDFIRSTEECLKQIFEFCELPAHNCVYDKDGVIFNKERIAKFHGTIVEFKNRNKSSNITSEFGRFFRIEKISNKNKTNKNDTEIKKYLSTKLEELGYS